MKLPSSPPDVIEHLLLDEQHTCLGPYPPKGFVLIENSEDACGDYTGLYWPFGREANEPLVCTMAHDDYSLSPLFSTVGKFIDAVRRYADDLKTPPPETETSPSLSHLIVTEEWEPPNLPPDLHWNLNWYGDRMESPTLEEDADSPFALVLAAEQLLEGNEIDAGISLLRHAVQVLPEYTKAWAHLCIQHRRRREEDLAAEAALMAMVCPHWLGAVPSSVLQHLRRMKVPPSLQDDPFIKRRARFRFEYGGEKTNDDYPLFRECIDEYFAKGDFWKGILLHQQYASFMTHETVAFQERYEFTQESFDREQTEYFIRHFKDPRELSPPTAPPG